MTPEHRDIFGPYEMPSSHDWAMQVAPGSILYYAGKSFFHRSERIPGSMVDLNDSCILPDSLLPPDVFMYSHHIERIGWRPWTDAVMNAHAEVGDFLYQWMKFVMSYGQTVYDLREDLAHEGGEGLRDIVKNALDGRHGDYFHEVFGEQLDATFIHVFTNAIFDRKIRGAEPVSDRTSIWKKLLTFRTDDTPGQVGELQELLSACLAMERADRHNARFGDFFLAVHQLIGFFENQKNFAPDGDGDDAFFEMLIDATPYVVNVLDALPGVSRTQLAEFALAKQRLRIDIGRNARMALANTPRVDVRAVTKGITALYEPYLVWRHLTRFYELFEE
jgi:hypothetical protein